MTQHRMIDLLTSPDTPWWVHDAIEAACLVDPVDAANVLDVIEAQRLDSGALVRLTRDASTPGWAVSMIRVMLVHGLDDSAPWVEQIAAVMRERVDGWMAPLDQGMRRDAGERAEDF